MKKIILSAVLGFGCFLSLFPVRKGCPCRKKGRHALSVRKKIKNTYGPKTKRNVCGFSWVLRNEIGGLECPCHVQDIDMLIKKYKIGLIVAAQDTQLPETFLQGKNVQYLFLNIKDLVPSQAAIQSFLLQGAAAVAEGKKIAVYCPTGLNRTGVMIACWLVFVHQYTVQDAIDLVRKMRPKSIGLPEQEKFLYGLDVAKIV